MIIDITIHSLPKTLTGPTLWGGIFVMTAYGFVDGLVVDISHYPYFVFLAIALLFVAFHWLLARPPYYTFDFSAGSLRVFEWRRQRWQISLHDLTHFELQPGKRVLGIPVSSAQLILHTRHEAYRVNAASEMWGKTEFDLLINVLNNALSG